MSVEFPEPDAEEIEQWCFEAFCDFHPHEAYKTWPDRFWEYFHRKCPFVSRHKMEQTLKETSHEHRTPQGATNS